MQDAINKQTPKDMEASRVVNTAVEISKSDMHAIGKNLDHPPGSREAATLAAFESGLRDQIIAAQQAKTGVPLSPEEARAIALGYQKDHDLYGAGRTELMRRRGKAIAVTDTPQQ